MTILSEDTQKMLSALQKSVSDALEKKRRLGQYAVICRDGKPVAIGEDAPDIETGEDNHSSAKLDS